MYQTDTYHPTHALAITILLPVFMTFRPCMQLAGTLCTFSEQQATGGTVDAVEMCSESCVDTTGKFVNACCARYVETGAVWYQISCRVQQSCFIREGKACIHCTHVQLKTYKTAGTRPRHQGADLAVPLYVMRSLKKH